MAIGIISYFEFSVNSKKIEPSKRMARKGGQMELKELINVKTSELVVELLHRKEVDVIFVENNDKAIIDMSGVNSYTNKDNRYVENAIILIYK